MVTIRCCPVLNGQLAHGKPDMVVAVYIRRLFCFCALCLSFYSSLYVLFLFFLSRCLCFCVLCAFIACVRGVTVQYNTQSCQLVAMVPSAHHAVVTSLLTLDNGAWLLTSSADAGIRLWSLTSIRQRCVAVHEFGQHFQYYTVFVWKNTHAKRNSLI